MDAVEFDFDYEVVDGEHMSPMTCYVVAWYEGSTIKFKCLDDDNNEIQIDKVYHPFVVDEAEELLNIPDSY